jgi:hypothetical protein
MLDGYFPRCSANQSASRSCANLLTSSGSPPAISPLRRRRRRISSTSAWVSLAEVDGYVAKVRVAALSGSRPSDRAQSLDRSRDRGRGRFFRLRHFACPRPPLRGRFIEFREKF